MKRAVIILTSGFLVLFLILPAGWAKPSSGVLNLTYHPPLGSEGAEISIEILWKVWTLLGEPVELSKAKWTVSSVYIKNNEGYLTKYNPDTSLGSIPEDVMNKVGINRLKVMAHIFQDQWIKYSWESYLLDPGVMGPPGDKMSYNVPGSTDWDRFFIKKYKTNNYNSEKIGYEIVSYVVEDKAKERFKNGFLLKLPEVVEISFDLTPVKAWLLKQEKAKKRKELARKVEKEKKEELKKLERERESFKAHETSKDSEQHMEDFFSTFEEKKDYREVKEEAFEIKRRAIEKKYSEDSFLADILKKEREIAAERKRIAALNQDLKAEIEGKVLPTESLNSFYDKKNRLYGFKGSKGNIVIPAKFHEVRSFSEGLAPVKKNSRSGWGFINRKGELMINYSFTTFTAFKNSRSSVTIYEKTVRGHKCGKNWEYGKKGIIDKKGNWKDGPMAYKKARHTICLKVK